MRVLVLASVWLGLLSGAIVALGWMDAFHLCAGALLLLVPSTAYFWIRRHRATSDQQDESDLVPHPVRSIFGHGIGAALCVAYLFLTFHLLHAAGVGPAFFDRDRPSFEEHVLLLEDSKQFEKAAELIQNRLGSPHSESWGRELAERLYRSWVHAGLECKDVAERRGRLMRALEAARDYRLDEMLAFRLIEECDLEIAYLGRVTTLRAERNWRALTNLLEAGVAEDSQRRRHLPLSIWLRDALLEWARESNDEEERKACFSRALDVCGKHGLDDHAAKLGMELLDKAVRDRIRPASLPVGAKGGIAGYVSDYFPPATIAEVWIEGPDGKPVEKLSAKDFVVYCGGKQIRDFGLHEENRKVEPMHLVVALDTSGSMQGAPMAAAEGGAKTLLGGLQRSDLGHGQIWVQVLTFSGVVRIQAPWTNDLANARAKLTGLKADGSTALYKTIAFAIDELRGRPGRKHLLLFTDGKDTDAGPDLEALIARCRAEGIVISPIGLRSVDLDAPTLRRLATETGGTYGEANGPEQLLEQFQKAASRLRPHFYRLVGLSKSGPGPIEIRVGAENGVILKGP